MMTYYYHVTFKYFYTSDNGGYEEGYGNHFTDANSKIDSKQRIKEVLEELKVAVKRDHSEAHSICVFILHKEELKQTEEAE